MTAASPLALMAGNGPQAAQSVAQLRMFMADTCCLSFKTHNFQWNVNGADAPVLALLFESQYKELCRGTDGLAERIRMLGACVFGGVRHCAETTILQDPPPWAEAETMMRILISDHETLALRAHIFATAMMREQDVLSADLMIERCSFHEREMRKIGVLLGCGGAEWGGKNLRQKYAH